MNKNIVIILLLLLGMTSCYEDLGNYTYGDKQPVLIDSLETLYERYSGDLLHIEPEIISDREITGYEWVVYDSTLATGNVTVLDSVKDLNYTVMLPQGSYQLLFKVTDADGYTEIAVSKLEVKTTYSEGFYVFKEMGNEADLDLFPTGKNPARELLDNVQGRRLQGKPEALFIAPQHKYRDSLSQKEFVLFPVTEHESPMVRVQDMTPVFDYEDLFWSVPTPKEKPLNFINAGSNYQGLLTDKHVYSYACIYPNISGKFSDYASFESEINPAPYTAVNNAFAPSLVLFYDNQNAQFLGLNSFNVLYRFKNNAPQGQVRPVEPFGLDCRMVYMKQAKCGQNAYAVMEHNDTKMRYLFKIQADMQLSTEINPIISVDTLPADLHIYQAENFTVSENSIYLYYYAGNQVYAYDILSRAEKPLELPLGDEEITMLDYLYWRVTPVRDQWSYFVLATYSSSRYKVYLYPTRGDLPDLSSEPVCYEGEGKVRDIQYVNPKMTTTLSLYPYN